MALTRLHARRVLAAGGPIDGTVCVEGSTIAWVGPCADAPLGADVDLGDVVLGAGLVDPWSALAPADALARGVTTLGLPHADERAIRAAVDAGLRTVAWLDVAGPAPADRDAALVDLRARLASSGTLTSPLVRLGVAPRSAADVHEDLLVDVAVLTLAERLPLAIPVGTSANETRFLRDAEGPLADALRARGVEVHRRAHSAVHLLAELGIAAAARPLLVMGPDADAGDRELAAYYGCAIVSLGSGPQPASMALLTTLGVTTEHLRAAAPPREPHEHQATGALQPGMPADLAAFPIDGSSHVEASFVMVGGRELRRL